nr:aminotransferase class III-fold pyridoxal phosphate-dependent enzyme [Pseudomonas chlororaphis]
MSTVIYKNLNASPILAVNGAGVWLEDASGKRYLDTCGGVAVSSLGHGHPRIAAAIEQQAKSSVGPMPEASPRLPPRSWRTCWWGPPAGWPRRSFSPAAPRSWSWR